jgi:hypothetical protein
MEFFNRKEEVLDIQMTQYGKYLLSKGKFKPKFYAFYDGDLIYDSNYGGFSENQNETAERIKETSRLKALSAFEGAETRIKKVTQGEAVKHLDIDEKAMLLQQVQPTQTKHYAMGGQLGTSDLSSDKAPSWSVRFLDGEMEGSSANYTGSIRNELIPQIDIVLETKATPVSSDSIELNYNEEAGDSDLQDALEEGSFQMFSEFGDDSTFKVESDSIILDITEEHAPPMGINYDVEVFEIEEDEKGNEDLKLLKFARSDNLGLKSDLAIQINNQVVGSSTTQAAENKMFTQYYIDLNFDGQIERPAATRASAASLQNTLAPPTRTLSSVPANNFVCPDEVNFFEADDLLGDDGTSGSEY